MLMRPSRLLIVFAVMAAVAVAVVLYLLGAPRLEMPEERAFMLKTVDDARRGVAPSLAAVATATEETTRALEAIRASKAVRIVEPITGSPTEACVSSVLTMSDGSERPLAVRVLRSPLGVVEMSTALECACSRRSNVDPVQCKLRARQAR